MNLRNHARSGRVLLLALVLAALCALVTGASAASLTTGDFQIPAIGGTVSVPITLDTAPAGLSGYEMTVTLGDGTVAEITAVTFPTFSFLSSVDGNSVAGFSYTLPTPASTVSLRGSDLGQSVANGSTNVVLATLTVRAKADGVSSIGVTPSAGLGIQDRNGNIYTVTTPPGSVTVGTPTTPTRR